MCDTDCSDLVKIHTLEELDMSDSHFKANVCALLCLPHLRVLHGPEKCSHAHGAPAEVSCTKLRTFSVHKCVSLPIVELSKMKELEEVSFSHCNLKTRDVVNLAGLQHLRILSICSTDIGDSALRSLGKCAFLEKLNLSVSIYLIDVSPLADVLTLEELNLRDCSCVKRGAGDLGRLPHLRILNLKNTGVTDSCLVGLGTSRSLVKLVLSSCRFVTDITPVLGIATLEELNVLDCKEMTPKEHDLSRLPNLRSLSIGRLDHFASKGSDLTCPFGLTNLNLRCDYQLSPTSSFIEKMQTLVELEVDDGLHINLDGLSQLPHLRTLSLHSLRYPQGVNSLLKCTSITKLHLIRLYKSTDLCPLEDMKSLDELHLTSINLLPNSVIGIPPFLRHLKVASCNVTNKSFSKICNSNAFVYLKLLHCKHLTDISFVQNMKRLEKFFLVCCGKVCNGLECLIKLPFLHYVYITRSLFTETLYSPLQEKGLTVIAHQFPQQLIL
ncbi:hypothetical protein, conserved in T. vivax [Trypanosoma vivax Y486]|uniref:Leucine-rich repeat protein (LRRP) n=1 Tax=Trypanosoma vivax (strain Y486) TaxID=1055687 RepID=F9WPB6_TRYVY|nr:hypothetical protein, conserved in T. vivax [Trypanosoma vivax Y486]|eukprot:CCD19392.1 hypothetical protein, conserved in T. vivax [Trypanosoma vivax Y486]